MKYSSRQKTTLLLPALSLFLLSGFSHAAVLLSTDFTGITIDGSNASQANNITWMGTALSAPSSLSLENVITVQNNGALYSNANTVTTTNGYFGGNTNISSGTPSTGQWGVTIQITVGGSAISLEDLGLNVIHATNTGTVQQNPRDTLVNVSVTDTSDSSLVGTASQLFAVAANSESGLDGNVTFGSALSLAANGVYDVTFLVDSPNENVGHYAAFGAVSFNGVPEPSAALLGGLGLLALLRRRR